MATGVGGGMEEERQRRQHQEEDDVDFLDDFLSKTTLPYDDIYTFAQGQRDDGSRRGSDEAGSLLDMFPWEGLPPPAHQQLQAYQEVSPTDRAEANFTPDPSLLADTEHLAEMMGRFFQDLPSTVDDNFQGIEASLEGALDANRKYQEELRMALSGVEKSIAGNKLQLHRLATASKKINAARRPSGPHSAACVESVKDSLAVCQIFGLDPATFVAEAGEESRLAYTGLLECQAALPMRPAKWSPKELGMLADGVKRANQRLLLDKAISEFEGDEARTKIREIQLMSDTALLENVTGLDWDFISASYLHGIRSPRDCQIQWTVNQHPMINGTAEWPKEELERLNSLVQKYGPNGKWTEIALDLGTNRTAFQCLETFQRKLNKGLLKGRWSPEEDARLLNEVQGSLSREGECSWHRVFANLRDRTPAQCLHRFFKNLDPAIRRGRWSPQEDAMLRMGVELHGRDWYLVCKWVPSRTDMQCRERWTNVLDPDLKTDEFTAEEDAVLLKAVEETGGPGSWAPIQAKHFPLRTDNQLRRRYKQLTGKPTTPPPPSRPPSRKKPSAPKPKQEVPKKRGRPRKVEPQVLGPRALKRVKSGLPRRQSARTHKAP